LLKHPKPYAAFVPLLSQSTNPEDPVPLLAASVLSSLISQALLSSSPKVAASSGLDDAFPKVFSYLTTLAKSSDAGLQDIAVQAYSSLLRTTKSRTQFWDQRQDTLVPLVEILRAAAGANGRDGDSTLWSGGSVRTTGAEIGGGIGGGVGLQLLYHVLLVIWQLSFEGELVGEGLEEYVAT
jgi:V-type H+-transporting ATPase subunit H